MTFEILASPEACNARGSLTVGGREVGVLTCSHYFGHGDKGVPHRAVIRWTDEAVIELPDADLLDPAEAMDVEVRIGSRCPVCGFHACDC